jgi:hypothetical protein
MSCLAAGRTSWSRCFMSQLLPLCRTSRPRMRTSVHEPRSFSRAGETRACRCADPRADRRSAPTCRDPRGAPCPRRIALRDHALEAPVLDGVILRLHGERLSPGSRLGPFGTAQLRSTPSSSKVVVEAARGVLLHHEREAVLPPRLPLGLGRAGEVSLASVCGEIRHRRPS